jgi:hypothetical protein
MMHLSIFPSSAPDRVKAFNEQNVYTAFAFSQAVSVEKA